MRHDNIIREIPTNSLEIGSRAELTDNQGKPTISQAEEAVSVYSWKKHAYPPSLADLEEGLALMPLTSRSKQSLADKLVARPTKTDSPKDRKLICAREDIALYSTKNTLTAQDNIPVSKPIILKENICKAMDMPTEKGNYEEPTFPLQQLPIKIDNPKSSEGEVTQLNEGVTYGQSNQISQIKMTPKLPVTLKMTQSNPSHPYSDLKTNTNMKSTLTRMYSEKSQRGIQLSDSDFKQLLANDRQASSISPPKPILVTPRSTNGQSPALKSSSKTLSSASRPKPSPNSYLIQGGKLSSSLHKKVSFSTNMVVISFDKHS